MKLITLNLWCGHLFEPLMRFLKFRAEDTDIFCFQEVYRTETDRKESRGIRTNLFEEISNILPDHKGYFAPAQDGFDGNGEVDFHLTIGNATFVRKNLSVIRSGDFFVYGRRNCMLDFAERWKFMPRTVLYVQFQAAPQPITIFNFHGLWNGRGKTDTEERLQQSHKIRNCLADFKDSKIILCGDFNLLPNTQSLSLLEANMRNLVSDYGITSTRSSHYSKPEKFADYVLVSPYLAVQDFRVLPDEVSDHLPLWLNFE